MITNIELQNAKPKEKDYTINVDTGLSLLVKKTGSKLWRFRYSFAGRRCMMSLGHYPNVSMKEARNKLRDYLELIDEGMNPAKQKQIDKIEKIKVNFTSLLFKQVALEWHTKYSQTGNQKQNEMVMYRLKKYIFPVIGNIPIKDIEAPMLFNMIEAIQDKGLIETGKRVNACCSMIFRYGVAKGYCNRDFTQDYRGMLQTVKSKHMPTLTEPNEIGELLHDMENYNGTIIVKSALMISAYVFLRPSELASSKWEYIDFDKAEWLIPESAMKMQRKHLIPISVQVKNILTNLYPITGNSDYIFPHDRDITRNMHRETINKTLRRIKDGKYIGKMVAHGFRGMASTILNEHKFRGEVIEKQLAHQESNKIRGAYNHAEYLAERTEMMQWYADYLDSLKNG